MKNKLILIFVIIVLIFVMGDNCYANSEKITKDLELNSYSSSNGEIIYGCNVDVESNDVLLSINAADYDLPSNLYDYKDEIRLRITYSQEDYKVYDCKVIN